MVGIDEMLVGNPLAGVDDVDAVILVEVVQQGADGLAALGGVPAAELAGLRHEDERHWDVFPATALEQVTQGLARSGADAERVEGAREGRSALRQAISPQLGREGPLETVAPGVAVARDR